ncbi:MAG: beta-lactamase family protein [Asgard group archaeon]|nr:beta-lactamase family protein [Asgard group archaeon]
MDDFKEAINKLENMIIDLMIQSNIPGFSVGIILNGQPIYTRGFGQRSLEKKLPMTPDTLFGIGSVSKSFTSLAIMQLVEKGKLNLDDPIDKYFNVDISDKKKPITIKHMLSHSSGIPDLGAVIGSLVRLDKNRPPILPIGSTKDIVSYFNKFKELIRFKPDEMFFYNNDMYHLLGALVEKITKIPFADYVTKNILEPIGMTRTTYYADKLENDPKKDVMTGYIFDPNELALKPIPFPHDRLVDAPGGLLSSINDMLLYAAMFMNNGKAGDKTIISPKSIETLWKPVIHTPYGQGKNPQYCFGWMREEDFFEETLIHHGGNVGVSSAFLALIPSKKIGVIVGGNLDNAVGPQISRAILAGLLGKTPEEAVPIIGTLGKIKPILGTYAMFGGGVKIELTMDNFVLMAKLNSYGRERTIPLQVVNLDELTFSIPVIEPTISSMTFKVHIDKEKNEIFATVDRMVLFKQ